MLDPDTDLDTGEYPVAHAPRPRRRRARALASAVAAAALAGVSGYAVGHVTVDGGVGVGFEEGPGARDA